jgi:site-specific recombinase XerD
MKQNKGKRLTSKKDAIFNEPLKKSFLADEIREGSRQSYERIFRITEKYEKKRNKDLNEFTLEELEEILYSFKANNRNTMESYGRIISSYLNWCVRNGLIKENILSDFTPESFEKYITNEETYISANELRRLEDNCANFQDAVILRLLFIGAGGRELSEIRNLKKNDMVFNKLRLVNTLKYGENGLPEKYTERFIDIDERTEYLINGAINQKQYMKRNGQMEERDNIRDYNDLVENDYVVRSSITKTENWTAPVDKFVVYRRIQIISETLGVELTAKFIQRSGMIYKANQLLGGKDVEPSLDDLKMVANQFNMKSHHNLKGFLTLENIRKVYPKEMDVSPL